MKRTIVNITIIFVCVFAGWYIKGRSMPTQSMPKGAMGTPVVFVQNVEEQNYSDKSEYIGIVEPIKYVDLKPEVSGNIEKVLFEEGSNVNKGQVLFVIDPDKYIANVTLKEAEVENTQANVSVLEKEYERRLTLYHEKHISQSSIEQAEASLIQAKALEKQAIANLTLAQIDLENSQIKAPISGVIGKSMVSEGHYVAAGSSALARIVQQNPIRVAFSVSDKEYLKDKLLGKENLSLEVQLANGDIYPEKLTSFFVDNQVDKDTATITIFAEFENKTNLLVAGNYVRVFVMENQMEPVISVPASAIGEDKYGSYVFVIAENNTVSQVRVKTGELVGANQIINSGLTVGEKVVIEGLQKIKDGQQVKVQEVQ